MMSPSRPPPRSSPVASAGEEAGRLKGQQERGKRSEGRVQEEFRQVGACWLCRVEGGPCCRAVTGTCTSPGLCRVGSCLCNLDTYSLSALPALPQGNRPAGRGASPGQTVDLSTISLWTQAAPGYPQDSVSSWYLPWYLPPSIKPLPAYLLVKFLPSQHFAS